MAKASKAKQSSAANLGFEAKLWAAADKLRGHMDASEYKHVVLGLIFLKYISDAFEEKFNALDADDREDRDQYTAENIFWVPAEARWPHILKSAKQVAIGKTVDDAMRAIEAENSSLKGVLPKTFASKDLNKEKLGEVIDLIGTIGLGDKGSRSKDILGRVYEYFIGRFAAAEGKSGGEFYTPQCVVKLLVEMIEPYAGRVFDPCCGSGGMFIQSLNFMNKWYARHPDEKRKGISVYGQESNPTTWKLARLNLAIRGIEADLGTENADSFHKDLHKSLKADFILANPPFNMSDWGGDRLKEDVRWKYGTPPNGNANYAWIQHFIHHLGPSGVAGFVMANGSMSSGQSGEGEIRRKLVEDDLVDCIIALPGQLFYTTQIPVCLWFLTRNKGNGGPVRRSIGEGGFRDRRGETLFIDARKLGTLTDRTHRDLSDDEISRVANTYHAWRASEPAASAAGPSTYADIPGFCKAAKTAEIEQHGFVLTPGRYVGAEDVEDDGEPFEEKMQRLTAKLHEQFAESTRLQETIRANLREFSP
jgi:type I restriction enzyme M protein